MLKPCACGSSEKDFKIDIGPFYVDECCLANGFDELGNKIKKPLDLTGLPTQEEIDAAAATLTPDLSPEPEDPQVMISDDQGGLRPATEEEIQKLDEMEIIKETNVTQDLEGNVLKTEDVPTTGETVGEKKAREKAEKKAKKDAEKAAKKAAQQA